MLKQMALHLALYRLPQSGNNLFSDISMFWAIFTISSSVTSKSVASFALKIENTSLIGGGGVPI